MILLDRGLPAPETQLPSGAIGPPKGRRVRTPGVFQPASLPPPGHSPVFAAQQFNTVPLLRGRSQGGNTARVYDTSVTRVDGTTPFCYVLTATMAVREEVQDGGGGEGPGCVGAPLG